ncbi:MAG: hypothetical protein D3924_17790 [Candidatus Electrothrix sp. AR4]|nr:hypothetical protein [Candidatus Electrothrix sp. AR4]
MLFSDFIQDCQHSVNLSVAEIASVKSSSAIVNVFGSKQPDVLWISGAPQCSIFNVIMWWFVLVGSMSVAGYSDVIVKFEAGRAIVPLRVVLLSIFSFIAGVVDTVISRGRVVSLLISNGILVRAGQGVVVGCGVVVVVVVVGLAGSVGHRVVVVSSVGALLFELHGGIFRHPIDWM